jgi:predicted ATPase
MIRPPDHRVRVFVSSTLGELAAERAAVRRAIERLRLSPVMFEQGARPHPPRELYRAYLRQSDVFVGVYWERYGWVAPGENVSGLEDEYRLAARLPQLLYVKHPAPGRESSLDRLLDDIRDADRASYRRFGSPEELEDLVAEDLASLLSEHFGSVQETTVDPVAPVPLPLTPTYGRGADVDRIVRLLGDGVRLLTLTGLGGVGKTRLALEVARVLAARGGCDVHFVSLAPVTSADLVVATIADQLRARDTDRLGALGALMELLRGRQVVLVLDNLEQVVPAGADLVRLLELVPGLQVLATSRQALRVRAEREVALQPLALPAQDATASQIADSPAVRLYLDRAAALGSAAAPGPALAELCRRLGGVPLAIELAAAGARVTGAGALLDRIGGTLDLASSGGDVPDRQRSLRATLDWSHDLLDDRERAVFARLGVFGGGGTLVAVEAVCGDDEPDVQQALAGLLDKSLIEVRHPLDGAAPRVELLDPVRAYARERLRARGQEVPTLLRHFEHHLDLARQAQPFLCGPYQREWAARVDEERANLRIAVDTGLAHGRGSQVLELVWDTLVYFYLRDSVAENRGWVSRLEQYRPTMPPLDVAVLDLCRVNVGLPWDGRDPGLVLRQGAEAFAVAGRALERSVSLHHLGLHHLGRGDARRAVEVLEEATASYEAIDHDWGAANVELTLGSLAVVLGDRDEADRQFRSALEHARRIGNQPQMALGLQGLALVLAVAGDHAASRSRLGEAVRLVVDCRSLTGASYCLEVLAVDSAARGDLVEAARLVGAARAVRRRLAVPEWTAAAAALDAVTAGVALPDSVAAGPDPDLDPFAFLLDELDAEVARAAALP